VTDLACKLYPQSSHGVPEVEQGRLWTTPAALDMCLQVLIDPPWEEYARRAPGAPGLDDAWLWQDIQALDIAAVADTPSFVFLWCASPRGTRVSIDETLVTSS